MGFAANDLIQTFEDPMKNRNFAFTFITSCLLVGALFAFATTMQAERLPQTVRPEHYTLALTPDLKAATFTGMSKRLT
jgi:hypothetical protein